MGGADGGGFAEVVDQEPGGVEGEAVVCQGLLIAFQPMGVYITGQVSCKVSDVPASLLCQVGCSFIACFDVVDDDPGTVGHFFCPVEEDHGDLSMDKGGEMVEVLGIE